MSTERPDAAQADDLRDPDDVDTSVLIAFTYDELLVLNRVVQRFVPLSREPELATLRAKLSQAIEEL